MLKLQVAQSLTPQAGEKGPDARRSPKAAGEAYPWYVEPAAEGANEADGVLWLTTLAGGREGSSCEAALEGCGRGGLLYVEPAAEGANDADGPLSAAC